MANLILYLPSTLMQQRGHEQQGKSRELPNRIRAGNDVKVTGYLFSLTYLDKTKSEQFWGWGGVEFKFTFFLPSSGAPQ